MDKKLSVVQRTTDKTGWDKSNQFNSTDIKNIKTSAVRNDKSLNAIPSPLARIHLFEAAFEMLDKDELDKTNHSGDAYRKIVSDCFDVFELIYNWNNHLTETKDELTMVKWQQETELKKLKSGVPGLQLLAETLPIFLAEDAFKQTDGFLIIKYKGLSIAGSSPFTGFFTTPNPLNHFSLYNPINRRNYFSKIIPFKERKPEIRKYIYDFFYDGPLQGSDSTQTVRNYLLKYEKEIPSEPLQLTNLNSSFANIFGQMLQSTTRKTDEDYFEKNLVRINFPLNDEAFFTPKMSAGQKNVNYLLPLTEVFFADFKVQEIPSAVTINEVDKDTVTVTIQKAGSSYVKHYRKDPQGAEQGRIIDLNDTYKIKVNIGIFPFLKVVQPAEGDDQPLPAEHYNDYYKVMLVAQDNNFQFRNRDFKLSFGINNSLISAPLNSNIIVTADERTLMDQVNQPNGSVYYTLRGTEGRSVCFDYMVLSLPEIADKPVKAAIVPRWRTRSLGGNQVDFAIDFGTTTTFIAYSDNKEQTRAPKPLSFGIDKQNQENDYPVALLSKPKEKRESIKWIDTFEEGPGTFLESIAFQNEEFLPSLLSNERYQIPFRTALYQKEGVPDAKKQLFSNTNISFVYQRFINAATQLGQRYITNLKWNVNTDSSYEESIKIYIEELFLLLRLKTILKDGNPKLSRVTWFSPLSFSPDAQRIYQGIWASKFKDIFRSDPKQLKNITESEAPYHYYTKKGGIDKPAAVLTIDIGGGTTDMMYVGENRALCTSVNFGANILWGNGYTDFKESAKENGIYNAVKDTIATRLQPTLLKGLNDTYTRGESPYSSDEIINFWIGNNTLTGVLRELDNGQFKLTYLLHFTALIYHACQILKQKNEPAPTCIIFSGNGSKYLDLIQNDAYISKICAYIARSVFEKESEIPQVILPEDNRKEATCYGGLYEPEDKKQEIETVTLLGTKDSSLSYAKYGDIDHDKANVFKSVIAGFDDFLNCFFAMNDARDLSFRTTFGIRTDLLSAKHYLHAKAAENLDVGYRKRKQTVGNEDPVTDSLFFNPLIGLLFKINKMTAADLAGFVPKKQFFASAIEGGNAFTTDNLTRESNHDTLYILTLDHLDPDRAEVILFPEDRAYKKGLSFVEKYLSPVCEWPIAPTGLDHQIVMKKPGQLLREGDRWTIKEKIQVEFN